MDIVEFALATAAVVLGAIVQVASGVGGGFIIVPLLAWINLSLVPAPVVFASISLSSVMAISGRQHIDWQHLPLSLAGIVPGSVAGAYILTVVGGDKLGIVFGATILLAIGITGIGPRVPTNRLTTLIASMISGAMGTSSGIGAAPLALVYQHETGPRIRATLAALYTGASLIILAMLFAVDKFGWSEARAGVSLVPGFVIGYWIANRFTEHVDRSGSRAVVLTVSALAAIMLIVRSV